jgi:hypothetical protein
MVQTAKVIRPRMTTGRSSTSSGGKGPVRAILTGLVFLFLLFAPTRLSAQVLIVGNASFGLSGTQMTYGVQEVENYYSTFSTSGSLAIEVWATSAPYTGGSLNGYILGSVGIGTLQGGYYFANISHTQAYSTPPYGTYYIVVALAEYNGSQYAIDDWRNISGTQTFAPPIVPATVAVGPQSATIVPRQTVSFSVTAAGTPPFVYTWFKNGNVISGVTGTTLVIPDPQPGDAGNYTAAVGNLGGSSVSGLAVLTVNSPVVSPSISAQPTPQTVTTSMPTSPTFPLRGNSFHIQTFVKRSL